MTNPSDKKILVVYAATVVAVAGASVSNSSAQVIRINRQASVPTSSVSLSQVADIRGSSSQLEAIKNIKIADAPAPGKTSAISLEQIRSALAAKKVNLAVWSLVGSTVCQLVSPATEPEDSMSGQTKKGNRLPEDYSTFESQLRRFVAEQAGASADSIELSLSGAAQRMASMTSPEYEFRFKRTGRRTLGLVSIVAEIREGGRTLRETPLLVQARVRKPVVIASRTINRGREIEESDVIIEERYFEVDVHDAILHVASVLAHRSNRMVRAGELIVASDLTPMPVVRRNEAIKVVVRRGGLTVVTSAIATRDGAVGDLIEVKRAQRSRDRLAARVTGKGTVQIDAPAGTVLAHADTRNSR
jgi:flagella basal body P-ring formation protein FlgA